jgi:hypothetical protein
MSRSRKKLGPTRYQIMIHFLGCEDEKTKLAINTRKRLVKIVCRHYRKRIVAFHGLQGTNVYHGRAAVTAGRVGKRGERVVDYKDTQGRWNNSRGRSDLSYDGSFRGKARASVMHPPKESKWLLEDQAYLRISLLYCVCTMNRRLVV